MKKLTKSLIVREDERVDLAQRPTKIAALYDSDDGYRRILGEHVDGLREQQEKLYAHDKYALLVVFQAMDAAGKDGCIKHVMSGVNPQGCIVRSFARPSAQELDHDFLWRTMRDLPERGMIGIFNRSYYEEVLIVRVKPEILAAQSLPEEVHNSDKLWKRRFRSIVDLERHLVANGTRVVKFHLHMSKEEQRQRLLDRIDQPDKNWKFKASDMEARKNWDAYRKAYEQCLSATSTKEAPWYVIPADDKRNARLLVSRVILETLEGMGLRFPEATADFRRQLQEMRKLLEADAGG